MEKCVVLRAALDIKREEVNDGNKVHFPQTGFIAYFI